MSHEIYINEKNKAAFAYTGSRDKIWHGLGQQMPENATIEEWIEQAGMKWTVEEGRIRFSTNLVYDNNYPGRKVLYRSDTGQPLSIVSDEFKIVQPEEVLEFFRDLIHSHGMKVSTAGCLFGGRRFWALAETDNRDQVISGDDIKSYLFFVTSVDGTLASCARFVSIRVVCHNTMQIALMEHSKNVVRKTHRAIWDSNEAKIDLGLLSNSFDIFMDNLRNLADRKMSPKEVEGFFKKTFFNPKLEESEQGWGALKKVNNLMRLYTSGDGAEMGFGTAYGAYNAITNLFTHGTGRKSPDKQFWNIWYENDKIKEKALQDLLELV